MSGKNSNQMMDYLQRNHPEALDYALSGSTSKEEASAKLELYCEQVLYERADKGVYKDVIDKTR